MNILQVSTYDTWGGAARIAWSLFQGYRENGHGSWLAVAKSFSGEDGVYILPRDIPRGPWSRFWLRASASLNRGRGKLKGAGRLGKIALHLSRLDRRLDSFLGRELSRFPSSFEVLDLPPARPDVLHIHNLHGGYFDLEALPLLSAQVPVILTLHDEWAFTGHCAYSIDCPRWQTGCGRCPDLVRYPAVPRDATAFNWQQKREIYQRSRFHLTTPSEWLMRRAEKSILAPAIRESRVISNGVDLSVFHGGRRSAAREALGIDPRATVLLFTAEAFKSNPYKDFATVRAVLDFLASKTLSTPIILLAVGDTGPAERIGGIELRYCGRFSSAAQIAPFYQAADIYLHAAKSDTFPTVILEALACGTPVVATDIGGIGEQVKSLDRHGVSEATGILTPPGDARGMSEAVAQLIGNPEQLAHLGKNATRDARRRFDRKLQIERLLAWYQELIAASRPFFCAQPMGQ